MINDTKDNVNKWDGLSHEERETLKERLAENGLIFGDCNPTSTQHWMSELMFSDKSKVFLPGYSDNSVVFENNKWTELGIATRKELQTLTGIDYQRGYLGLWV